MPEGEKRHGGIPYIRGRTWILVGVALSVIIVWFNYASFRSFKDSIVDNFRGDQKVIARSMHSLILDHIDEARQNIDHVISMIEAGGDMEVGEMSVDMVREAHSEDFVAITLLKGYSIVHTSPPELQETIGLAIREYVLEYDYFKEVFVSERAILGDAVTTHLFRSFMIPGDDSVYHVVGSINLRDFVQHNITTWGDRNLCFMMADYLGDIYAIANVDHPGVNKMEKGNIFNLGDECLECHSQNQFSDIKEAIDTGGIRHAVQMTPEGTLLNRTTIPFGIHNETWTLSVCAPYEDVQGAIDRIFTRNAFYTGLLLLLLGGLGAIAYSGQRQSVALEERASNEEKLQALMDNMPAGIFESTVDGRYLSVNRQMAQMFGYRTTAEFMKHSAVEIYDDPKEREEFIAETAAAKVVRDRILRLKRRDGEVFLASVTASGEFDEGGTMVSVRGYVQDLTEKMILDDERRKSEERYRKLFEGAGEGIVILFRKRSGEMVITSVNSKAQEIFGAAGLEDMVGKSPADFSPPYQPSGRPSAAIIEKLGAEVMEGKQRTFEWTLKRVDSSEVIVEMSVTRLDVGEEIYQQVVVRDISERKKAEVDRLRIDRLRSVSTLAGGIAHDFNNILTSILGNIGLARLLVRSGTEDREQLESAIDEAEKACDKASLLTSRMLSFAKKSPDIYRRKLANLDAVIKEDAAMALHGANVGIEYSIDKESQAVFADPGMIGQVIHNLVKNAREAMPGGGVIRIRSENDVVSQHPILDPGTYVRVDVADEGEGMSEEVLGKIFDAYFTTKDEGQGLGLASVHNIIRQHGGHIEVESKVGVGTTFSFYLPTALRGESYPEETPVEVTVRGKGERILVIDDDEDAGETVRRILESLGYKVSFFNGSAGGISTFKEAMDKGEPVQLVITDLTLPNDLDGVRIREELLKIDPTVKVILTSGHLKDPTMTQYRDHGFDAVLPKPIRAAHLSVIVSAVLKADDDQLVG